MEDVDRGYIRSCNIKDTRAGGPIVFGYTMEGVLLYGGGTIYLTESLQFKSTLIDRVHSLLLRSDLPPDDRKALERIHYDLSLIDPHNGTLHINFEDDMIRRVRH